MTCIVGLVEDGKVWMGGDSASTAHWNLRLRRDPKVFCLQGYDNKMLVGISGYPRMAQLLRHEFTLPSHPTDISVSTYLATIFVNTLRTVFKDAGYAQKDKEQELTDSQMLIGYRGHVMILQTNYQLDEQDNPYDAIGCGESFALGVLYATKRMKPQQRIRLALEAAEHFSAGVRGPFTIDCLEE